MIKKRAQKKPFQVRQGDVFVMAVDEIPGGATRIEASDGRFILALGEVTGHAHAIAERDVEAAQDSETIYLRILEAPDLPAIRHEEHGAITLPPGIYQVRRQVEYQPDAIRRVAD